VSSNATPTASGVPAPWSAGGGKKRKQKRKKTAANVTSAAPAATAATAAMDEETLVNDGEGSGTTGEAAEGGAEKNGE
jgi:hypothetical protein